MNCFFRSDRAGAIHSEILKCLSKSELRLGPKFLNPSPDTPYYLNLIGWLFNIENRTTEVTETHSRSFLR